MVRVKQTSTEAIFVFIALNLIPSFFENLPVASWLASCMTIKEMYQQNEWETLSLLNVPLKKVFSLIAIAGLVLMACSFLGKEFLSYRFAQTAEQFKQEQFKQNHHTKLFNRWLVLTKSNNKKNFCHFDYLDLTTKRGLRFTLFEISDQFSLQKTTCAKTFSIDPPTKKITLSNSTTLETSSRKILSPETKQLVLPSFFTQLTIQDKTPPITQIVRLLLFSKKVLPDYVYHQLLYLFLNRILIHLLLLLYPLLTFMLFFLFPHHRYTRWTLIMTPYPLAVLIFTATDSLMQTIHYGALAIIPYVILSLVALGAYKNIP